MFVIYFFAVILIMLLIRALAWKPLDTSILYKDHPYLLFGHRGSPVHEPENTIPSFKRALADGCNAIELDVHLTRDDQIVVIHDHTLERTTNGQGEIKDYSLAELHALNAAHSWSGREESIPTLQAVIDALPTDVILNFEIKEFSFSLVTKTESLVADFVQKNNLRDRVIISSFNPICIWRMKRADPSIFTAFLWENEDLNLFSFRNFSGACLSNPDFIHPSAIDVKGFVKFWSGYKKMPLHVWTINDADGMKKFAGDPLIKGIMSDDSELLVDTVGYKVK
jgi:glycerophosphoryl diester phosphodiesterase